MLPPRIPPAALPPSKHHSAPRARGLAYPRRVRLRLPLDPLVHVPKDRMIRHDRRPMRSAEPIVKARNSSSPRTGRGTSALYGVGGPWARIQSAHGQEMRAFAESALYRRVRCILLPSPPLAFDGESTSLGGSEAGRRGGLCDGSRLLRPMCPYRRTLAISDQARDSLYSPAREVRDEAGLRVPVAISCFRDCRPLSGVGGINRSGPMCRERPICVRACLFGRKYPVRRIKRIRIGTRIKSMRKRSSNRVVQCRGFL